jgi:TolB-like protein/class 3 adenylate cyclase/Flp pilus assembly protein TadD
MRSDRFLATVLFTDIVGSTERAAALGDRRWRELLETHHALVRRELQRHRGRELNVSGDGFLVTFETPERALRCACDIRDQVRRLGLEVRSGLHTGEVEVVGGSVGGIGVHIGARGAALAGPGEVLVSSTVRDVAAGSGFEFQNRGEHQLKGLPGEWRLYAVVAEPLRLEVAGFWERAREARLPRMLLLYVAAAGAVLWLTSSLSDRLGLPEWVLPLAVVLLLVGLVVLAATAWVQVQPLTVVRAERDEVPGSWELDLTELRRSVARGRLPHLTWGRWILGGVVAFALLFGLAGIYVLVRERSGGSNEAAGARQTLAVLPFQNLGSAEDEYFADGLTEEITARLAGVRDLAVTSRTTAMRYKESEKPVKQIGSELGVAFVLEGTVRWQKSAEGPDRVRITPQLIRVADDTHVWAEVYDRVLAEVFQIQSAIAEEVVGSLGVALLERERRTLESTPTENLEAYDYYLRGRDYQNRGYDEEDLGRAEQLYLEAVRLDSNFALAFAHLSRVHSEIFWYFFDRTDARLTKAKAAADRALEIDPGLADGHIALAYYHYWGHLDYVRALEHLSRAQEIKPNDPELFFAMAPLQRRQGQFAQAVVTYERGLALDPRNHVQHHQIAETHRLMRNYPVAERALDRAISLAPDFGAAYIDKVLLYLSWEGSREKARRMVEQAKRQIPVSELLPQLIGGSLLEMYPFEPVLGALDAEMRHALETASLQSFKDDSLDYFLSKAALHGSESRPELERAYYDSTRALLEEMIRQRPGEGRYHTLLGIAYAALGRRSEAIREGRRGVELRPPSKDALAGPILVRDLAQIYTIVGEEDLAIDQLELLLSIPGRLSVPWIRLDTTWDALREHPRFKKLNRVGAPSP